MAKKRRRIRKNKDGLVSPRKVLDNGHYLRLSFAEKVFVCLIWNGFSNAEAWRIVNPNSDANPNSQATMAGRMSCNPQVKCYLEVLNEYLSDGKLCFKGLTYKVCDKDRAVDEWRSENNEY